MKKYMKIITAMCFALLCLAQGAGAESFTTAFNKYELISTSERVVAGVDPEALIAYCINEGAVGAYDITEDIKLFDFDENWGRVAPFYEDGTAVVIDREGMVLGFVSQKGKIVADIRGEYAYSNEYSNGFVCLIDKAAEENVYTIVNRKGEVIADNFFEPECELKDGSIIIANAGGGFSRIMKNGKVENIPINKTIKVEDAVSIYSDIYVGTDGSLYNLSGKLLLENKDYGELSPLTGSRAVAVKTDGTTVRHFVVDIKNKKTTEIKDNGFLTEYVYTTGDMCDGNFFVGNMEKSVLVNAESGEVLSEVVTGYSKFYEKLATVKMEDEKGEAYRFMKSDGTLMEGKYAYATDFSSGYALTVEKSENETLISLVYPNGDKQELYSCDAFDEIKITDKKAVLSVFSENGGYNEISVQKTPGGNLYIGGTAGNNYVYAVAGGGSVTTKTVLTVIALLALCVVVLALVNTAHRKKEKHSEK